MKGVLKYIHISGIILLFISVLLFAGAMLVKSKNTLLYSNLLTSSLVVVGLGALMIVSVRIIQLVMYCRD